jgi:DNA repair protein SbcD/Mre11
LFDIKQPSRNSHNLVKRVIEVHKEAPCPVWSVIGNHDVKFGDPKFIDEAPLGVVAASGALKLLPDEGILVNGLHIVPVHYHGVRYDKSKIEGINKHPDAKWMIVVCHLLASEGEDTTMFEGEDIIGYNYLDTVAEEIGADAFFFGHWHADQGIKHRLSGERPYWVVNVGSLSRGSLSKDNLSRNPCVVEMQFSDEGVDTVRHNLKVRPASEVFDLEKKIAEDEQEERIEEFAKGLNETLKNKDVSEVPLDKLVERSTMSDRVIRLAKELLEEAK